MGAGRGNCGRHDGVMISLAVEQVDGRRGLFGIRVTREDGIDSGRLGGDTGVKLVAGWFASAKERGDRMLSFRNQGGAE